MAPIAGKYEYVSNENLVEFLKAIGTPADRADKAVTHAQHVNISVDGNKIELEAEGRKVSLVVGEEVDDKLPNGSIVKSSTQLNGDTLTVTTKGSSGKTGTRVHQFSDTGLVLTMSGDYHPVVAKVTYKRV